MPMRADKRSTQEKEEGTIYFHGVGLASAEWEYRDHTIVAIMCTEYNDMGPEDENTLRVFYNRKDVTDRYVEQMYEVTRIRTTLANLCRLYMLIDENMDNFIVEQLKEKEGGE